MMKNNIDIINNLKGFINKGSFEYITDAEYSDSCLKTLMFPTDDLHLTKEQFACVKSLLNDGDTICVMQMEWGLKNGLFDVENQIFQLQVPPEYSEYSSLALYTITLLFPTQFNWIVLVEENVEGGEAYFIGNKEVTTRFRQIYASCQNDLAKYVMMCLRENKSRGVKLRHLERMLEVLSD